MSGSDYVSIFERIGYQVEQLILAMQTFWEWITKPVFFQTTLTISQAPEFDLTKFGESLWNWFLWLYGSMMDVVIWLSSNMQSRVFEFFGANVGPMSILDVFLSGLIFVVVLWSILKSFII